MGKWEYLDTRENKSVNQNVILETGYWVTGNEDTLTGPTEPPIICLQIKPKGFVTPLSVHLQLSIIRAYSEYH